MGHHGISEEIMGYHVISCDFFGAFQPICVWHVCWWLSSPNCSCVWWIFCVSNSFLGLSRKIVLGFIMDALVFPLLLYPFQPRLYMLACVFHIFCGLYRFWCLLVCVLQILFGCPARRSPKNLKEQSSPQICRKPGATIQPTDPKILEGLSSP